MSRPTLVRLAIFAATVAATSALLLLGAGEDPPDLTVGRLAPQRFEAQRTATVEDVEETERLKDLARAEVEVPRSVNAEVELSAMESVEDLFDDLELLAPGPDPVESRPGAPDLPPEEPTTTTSAEDGASTTTTIPEVATVTGALFIDADEDGLFISDSGAERADQPLANVTVTLATNSGSQEVETDENGLWTFEFEGGAMVASVDLEDEDIPRGYYLSVESPGQLIDCAPGDLCSAEPLGFIVSLTPMDEFINRILADHTLPEPSVAYLVSVASDDVIRAALGEPLHLPTIEDAVVTELTVQFAQNIEPGEELQAAKNSVTADPPFVFHVDTLVDPEGQIAAADVVVANLQANYLEDLDQYADDLLAAEESVTPVVVGYDRNQLIVDEGVAMTALDIAAIRATAAPTVDEQSLYGLLAVVSVLVALLGLYLSRFRPEFFAKPRMVALLGIMIVLSAAAVRGAVALQELLAEQQSVGWYVLPAVAFGFMTAVLFDQRIAVLMALAVAVVTALGTLDIGVTVYAGMSALAPIPFVSSVSTRGSFRNAVVLSALAAAVVAAATAWFFHVGSDEFVSDVVPAAVAISFGVSAVASLIGLAALQFFEAAFDITTTLGLLDLTDRNHKALQVLQEKAFGTFNHSLMVGTLADAAARAIGANALLARAMAYYHDLGKTEHPTFFIENQFGMTNPHDDLDPVESARIIRSHVTEGVALAREYKIPTEVTEGIVSHHGDGVMRYFYEKARQLHGDDVDIDDFRHVGHKPRTAETAIVMMSDALEAACRAVFQTEEPSPDAIEKVVDRVINEKVDDGQLSESPLTLAQLTKVRKAFLDSLTGHYHQRIAYPNFPGS